MNAVTMCTVYILFLTVGNRNGLGCFCVGTSTLVCIYVNNLFTKYLKICHIVFYIIIRLMTAMECVSNPSPLYLYLTLNHPFEKVLMVGTFNPGLNNPVVWLSIEDIGSRLHTSIKLSYIFKYRLFSW